jgi:hypothetical protein
MHLKLIFAFVSCICIGMWWFSSAWQARVPTTNPEAGAVVRVGPSQANAETERSIVTGGQAPLVANPGGLQGASDGVAGMHLQPAPAKIQDAHARLAEQEMQNFEAQANSQVASPTGGVDSYLSYLVLIREARVRKLIREAFMGRRGVLVFDGVDDKGVLTHVAGRVSFRYFGVSTHHGRSADLLVCCPDDHDLKELSESINGTALAILQEFIARFNSQTEEYRRKVFSEVSVGGLLPGLSKDVWFFLGDRIKRHTENALLSLL